eukprot:scaffold12949_cov80-Skeletonema_marinoi.AAC.1
MFPSLSATTTITTAPSPTAHSLQLFITTAVNIMITNHHSVSSFAFGSLANTLRRRWSLSIAIPLSRFARHIIIGGGG